LLARTGKPDLTPTGKTARMTGSVEWAVLIFMGCLAIGSMGLAWKVRGYLAAFELKYDLSIADLTKDVRHLKNNLAQHIIIYGEMHDDVIRSQAEVQRLAKIVNGKH